MPELRALNETGMKLFRNYLSQLREAPALPPPLHLLEGKEHSARVEGSIEIDVRAFETKREFGEYAVSALADVPHNTLRSSGGLWAWLALFYFDSVCPTNASGDRKALGQEKYICSTDARKRERHILFFPWKMCMVHRGDAEWFLGAPLRDDNKFVRELARSYRHNVSPNFIRLARSLYLDQKTGRLKRGATSTARHNNGDFTRPGNMRRLGEVLNQLDMTYDIFGMDEQQLLDLLPAHEFKTWIAA